ncbi:hypothetical protein LZ554_005988 [Drepanopeziza brunnea f. sp. 'monogermtubi']|nr:hypothetical protein LZ554_005988 [Drepanopeziza brunnea f. sp. 'monogermtubi']
MHAVALQAFRTAQRPATRRACRIVAGSRHPLPHRNFHRSPISRQSPEDPAAGPAADAGKEGQAPKSPDLRADEAKFENGTAEDTTASTEKPEGLPPVVLPEWFYEHNIKRAGSSKALSGSLAVYSGAPAGGVQEGDDTAKFNAEIARQFTDISACGLETKDAAKYSIQVDVYREILATLKAGLALRPPELVGNQPVPRPVTVLQCPKDGGSYYLDSIVETVASKLEADLIRLDAQDLAQLVGSYAEGNPAWHWSKTGLLAYEAHKTVGKLESYDKKLDSEKEEPVKQDEEEDDVPKLGLLNLSEILSRSLGRNLGKFGQTPPDANGRRMNIFSVQAGIPGMGMPSSASQNSAEKWNDLKMCAVLEALISAADSSAREPTSDAEVEDLSPEKQVKPLIVQVRDYKEMSGVPEGSELLYKLRTAVNKKWQAGKDIILVGTTVQPDDPLSGLSRPGIQHLQSDIVNGEQRTIFVPPERREHQDTVLEKDEKARLRSINIRNVEEMILNLTEGTDHLVRELDIEKDLDSATVFSSGLEEAVWTYARVHRTAMTILGSLETPSSIYDGNTFSKALTLLSASDNHKFAWGAAELKEEDLDLEVTLDENETFTAEKKKAKAKLRELRKKCNQQESKLLSGVVLPSEIRTTFADIRAPKETVEALKTLTSLSLLRPEAFSYGVLATDKIPGVLLYGPPGTGKTLLAKAVAKESGATVLEVTAADLNDMFVGQGEKNVRAVFTLAKKLSPCVVFIDEADAIFSARGEHNRNAHREMINQFLREWDGMNDFSAFIMVATNRPFDLDEAVLRRLPRRLLVDLPVEKDREEILKIHLKDEILDDSVSLSKLAADTPFYSGSDLKNLSVAAALACIREENAEAAKHTGEEKYVYPEKRTLTKAHFDKASEEISASISEDMSTLTAIRKFDEKYGDRKGRKKKGPGLGFGGTKLEQKDSEAARVRKMGL